jgi:hypothetical protein
MKNEFRFFKLSVLFRLILTGALFFAGVLAQSFTWNFFVALPFYFSAYFFVMVKKITNKPDDQGFEDWKPVTDKEVDRLYDMLKRSKELSSNAVLQGAGVGIFLVALIVGGIISGANDRFDWLWVLANAVFMFWPAVFFGNVNVFLPLELDMKTSAFYHLMSQTGLPGTVMTPFLRFDKDKLGKTIPEDIKMMLELKRKPDWFIGVQFQVAINNGPNGNVPYMYAVILTKGRDNAFWKAGDERMEDLLGKKFVIEQGGDDEYGTVVIRQQTGGTGYHTKNPDIAALLEGVEKYLKAAA